MVKNKGGKKTKGKARKSYYTVEMSLKDLRKVDDQEYAHIAEVHGDGRYGLICYDKVKRLGIMRGSLRRKVRAKKSDIVLVSLRDFQDSKCDIIAHYKPEEVDKLVKAKEMSYSFVRTGELKNEIHDELGSSESESEDDGVFDDSDQPIMKTGLNIEDI